MEIGWLIEELDEVIYLSDPETYEILFVNRACRKDLGLDSPDDYLSLIHISPEGYTESITFRGVPPSI